MALITIHFIEVDVKHQIIVGFITFCTRLMGLHKHEKTYL